MQRDFTVLIGFNCCTGEGQKILHANHGTAVFRNYGDIFLFALIIKGILNIISGLRRFVLVLYGISSLRYGSCRRKL